MAKKIPVLRREIAAMREIGVPQAEIRETLADRRYSSSAKQRAAIKVLKRKYGGTHAADLEERSR